MLDIKKIRDNRTEMEELIQRKEPDVSLDRVISLDEELRSAKTKVETLKAERNEASKKIGALKREGKDAKEILEKVSAFADEIHELDHQIQTLQEAFDTELSLFPNLPREDIPNSQDVKENVILREHKELPTFSFTPKNHLELNETLNLFDFNRGAKLTGKGWAVYRGLGARLEWALLQYMIEVHIKNGFEQWMTPLAVRKEMMYGSGQLPKFEDQQFKFDDKEYPFYMIPTAEVPLNGLFADEILPADDLPMKMVAYTPCFRREAGAAGANERGLIRMHQFNKVEMFCLCPPEESAPLFDSMVQSAEEILKGLDLHHRSCLLVTGDMSFSGHCTVDVEVWLPGQERYYEVSSISNCTDYQSRRSKIRYRKGSNEKPEFVHTLNGSGLATSRLMVGLLECNQQEDGSVLIPKVLQDKMGGIDRIAP